MKTNDETGEVEGTGNDARVARLNAIGNAIDVERADQLADVVDIDKGLTEQFVAEDLTEEQVAARESAAQARSHDSKTAGELTRMETEANGEGDEQPVVAAPTKHKVKLGGREVEMTTEELIARAAQVEDANTYLAEAQRIRDEAARAPVDEHQPDAEASAQARKERLRERVRAIQMGSEDEAVEALDAMERERGEATPQLDARTLSKAVDERMAFNEAKVWVQDEYKDLFGDDRLRGMFLAEESRLVHAGDRRSFKERYKAVGDDLRGWVTKFQPAGAPADAPADLNSRREAKRQASRGAPPAQAAQRAALDEDDNQPESTSAVIQKMAEVRGGSQRTRG